MAAPTVAAVPYVVESSAVTRSADPVSPRRAATPVGPGLAYAYARAAAGATLSPAVETITRMLNRPIVGSAKGHGKGRGHAAGRGRSHGGGKGGGRGRH
jgi:hypothetical protein